MHGSSRRTIQPTPVPRWTKAAIVAATLLVDATATADTPAGSPAATVDPDVLADESRPIADPPHEPTLGAVRRAKELYNEGANLAQKGDLHGAFRAFRGAYEQDGTPEALANMAVVERALGRSRAAAEHLDAAIQKLPASQASKLPDLRDRLTDICKDITVLTLKITAAGTQVYVDDRWYGGAPVERVVYVDPGPHLVIVRTATGSEIRRRVDAKKGATETVAVDDAQAEAASRAAAAATLAASPAPSAAPERPLAPWILAGTGVAFAGLAGAGLGVYLRAHDWRLQIDADTRRLGGTCSPPSPGFVDDCRARNQEASNETIGMVLSIVGGVGLGGLAIGGLMIWLTPPSSGTSAHVSAPPRVTAFVKPLPGGLAVQGQF